MAQIIKQRRGSITQLKDVTARISELVVATGSIGNLNGPFLFVGETEGVAGAYRPVSKIYQGAAAPTITVGSYGSVLDGTPFYASGNKSLYILSQAGNSKIDLTGNIEGNTISGVTINSLTGSNADITSITGSISGSSGKFLNLTGTTFTSTNGNITALTGSNAYIGNLSGGTLNITGTTNLGGDLNISGNIIQTGSIDLTGNVTLGGNIYIGNQTSDLVVFQGEVSSSILPELDNSFDLGAPLQAWRDLYVSGTANVGTLNAETISLSGITVFEDLVVSGSAYLGQGGGDNVIVSGSIYNDALTDNRVLVAGPSGQISDSQYFTYDEVTLRAGAFEVDIMSGVTRMSGSLLVKDSATVTGSLNVSGSANIVGPLDVKGNTTTTGSLNVSGSANIVGSVDVKGDTTATGSLNVSGSANIVGPVDVKGDTTVTGSLKVSNYVYAEKIYGTTTNNNSLHLNGGDLNAPNVELESSGQISLFSEGAGSNYAINMTGSVYMLNDLNVTGSATFLSGATVTGSLNVSGTATVSSSVVEDLTQHRIVGVGSAGALIDYSGLTYDGTTFKIGDGQFEVDNSDGDIRTSGSLTSNGFTSNGDLTVNGILTVTGDTQLGANLYVSGNLEVLGSATNVNLQSSTVEIGDNIILVNAYSPFQQYAGLAAYDSGSGGASGSLLWDSLHDYWMFVSSSGQSSKLVGTTAGTYGSEVNLTSGTFPIATANNTIGDSLLTYSGTTLALNTNKFTIDSGTGDTLVSGNFTLSYSGGTDNNTKTSAIMFRNSSNVVGFVSTTETEDVLDGILGYKNSNGGLVFSTVIDGGTY